MQKQFQKNYYQNVFSRVSTNGVMSEPPREFASLAIEAAWVLLVKHTQASSPVTLEFLLLVSTFCISKEVLREPVVAGGHGGCIC